MSEANNNANQFDVASGLESVGELDNNSGSGTEPTTAKPQSLDKSESNQDAKSIEKPINSDIDASATVTEVSHSTKKMDWQNVAHKLREYNRKLLKKVFKLEQDLADIENKYKTESEKSQDSDRLIAQQAKEIKEFQEQVAKLSQQLEATQQETKTQEIAVENLSNQLITSQKQTAQLERECALLQETCNHQSYQLLAKTQQAEELSSRLTRQQRYTLQYKAALDNYLNKITTAESEQSEVKQKSPLEVKNPPIKAWSSSSKDPSISLPLTKTNPIEVKSLSHQKRLEPNTSKTTEWPAPAIAQNKTTNSKKPQSLAAVKLPRFPRQ